MAEPLNRDEWMIASRALSGGWLRPNAPFGSDGFGDRMLAAARHTLRMEKQNRAAGLTGDGQPAEPPEFDDDTEEHLPPRVRLQQILAKLSHRAELAQQNDAKGRLKNNFGNIKRCLQESQRMFRQQYGVAHASRIPPTTPSAGDSKMQVEIEGVTYGKITDKQWDQLMLLSRGFLERLEEVRSSDQTRFEEVFHHWMPAIFAIAYQFGQLNAKREKQPNAKRN